MFLFYLLTLLSSIEFQHKENVYPDIANKLLAQDKVIKPIANSIDDELLEANLITCDTPIQTKASSNAHSSIIRGLFDDIEED